jgi:hypothetical protein
MVTTHLEIRVKVEGPGQPGGPQHFLPDANPP